MYGIKRMYILGGTLATTLVLGLTLALVEALLVDVLGTGTLSTILVFVFFLLYCRLGL